MAMFRLEDVHTDVSKPAQRVPAGEQQSKCPAIIMGSHCRVIFTATGNK
jgi:hypothetical protein